MIPHDNHQINHVLRHPSVNAVGERVSMSSSMMFGKNLIPESQIGRCGGAGGGAAFIEYFYIRLCARCFVNTLHFLEEMLLLFPFYD